MMKGLALLTVLVHIACLQPGITSLALGGKAWPIVPPADVELLDGYDNPRSGDSVLETHSISGRGFLKTVRNRRRTMESEAFANEPDDNVDVSAQFEEQYEIARVKRETPSAAAVASSTETDESLAIQRSPRGVTRQDWMKQPLPVEYPTLDDQEAAAATNEGIEARAPRVNFITRKLDTAESRDQRESSPRPRIAKPTLRTDIRTRPYYDELAYDPLYESYDMPYDPYYEPAGYRRRARFYDETMPPSRMMFDRYDARYDGRYDNRYDMRYDRYDNRRFDAYRRNEDLQGVASQRPTRQQRIIYYATLPDPAVYRQMYGQRRYDVPERDRYPASSYRQEPRGSSPSPNDHPREMLREAQPQNTPSPVRVSATVGVREDARSFPQQRFIASQNSPVDYSQPVSFQVVEDTRSYSQRN